MTVTTSNNKSTEFIKNFAAMVAGCLFIASPVILAAFGIIKG